MLVLLLVLVLSKPLYMVFYGAGLWHAASDFAPHTNDARPHFWPVRLWMFEGPPSYWDTFAERLADLIHGAPLPFGRVIDLARLGVEMSLKELGYAVVG